MIAREIVTELERLGVPDYSIERGRKHPKLRINVNGASKIYVLPGTSSDHRALRNAICGIRRLVKGMA
ncbi:hypothetical protein [Magnetospirillum molischianum]|uniref:Uncharacterized protein n=1 Tax=Magnetospirillum molischianum DSM 120 TaxID=1150626 RepID=H8FYC8_MAGML|nr:hypothetical protein [Magnetospirillum molischianum]CCG43366.1 conserved hypothetical protein [Magnetospirillum molischianum DSM 120]